MRVRSWWRARSLAGQRRRLAPMLGWPGPLELSDAEADRFMAALTDEAGGRWRVGGHWLRTLIIEGQGAPDGQGRRPGDRLVGMVDTAELAAEIVAAVNAAEKCETQTGWRRPGSGDVVTQWAGTGPPSSYVRVRRVVGPWEPAP